MIGNKHFKTWLKGLDPITRVEKMRDIAKSQAITGLKGSLIKESLAQLSQKCQVMLIRLGDEDISRFSRKSQVKSLDNPKFSNSKTKDYCQKQKHKDKNKRSLKKLPNKDDVYTLKTPSKHSSKLDQKIRELFGDDPDDHTNAKDSYPNVPSAFDKNINQYVSNTFNVNIFKSSSRTRDETDQISAREISAGTVLPNKVPNKILRIDVSLCNEDSDIKSNLSSLSTSGSKNSQHKSMAIKQSSKTKRKLSCDSSHNNVAKTKRKKKSHKGSVSLNEDEDPSIEELWKILGMESPTDRSESIIKSYPLPTQGPSLENSQDILNHNVLIQSSTTEKTDYSYNKLHEADVTDNSSQNSTTNFAEGSPQCPSVTGPVCEIAEAFNPSNKPHSKNTNTLVEETDCSNKDSFDRSEKLRDQIHDTGRSKDDVNTISLLTDDIDDSNTVELARKGVEEKQTLEKSKVGTIRVRDIGSLMKQPSPHSNATLVASSLDQPSTSKQPSTSVNETQYTIADRFLVTYRHYFDELVESKIPKMGELLHLAIADLNRKYGRIKIAEQLASDELIVDEKERAEKEINNMMRTRGVELSSLCETIINRFDQASKITLFIVLFRRLLKHAEKIDPANKHYIREAKDVMYMMLTKANFKDKDIVDLLNCDYVQFTQQLDGITGLFKKSHESQLNREQNLNKQLNVPRTNDTIATPRSIAREPQLLPSKLTPAASPVSNVSATVKKGNFNSTNNMPLSRVDIGDQLIRNESRTNDTYIKPRSQPTVASESQSLTPRSTSKPSAVGNLTATVTQVSRDSVKKVPCYMRNNEPNESRRNHILVKPRSQPNEPQSLTPKPRASPMSKLTATVSQASSYSVNSILLTRLNSEVQAKQISPNTQPEKIRGRSTIYKAVIRNESQMNNRIILPRLQPTIAGQPQSTPPKTSSVNNCNGTIPQVNFVNNMTQFRIERDGQINQIVPNAQPEQTKGTANHFTAALMLLKNANRTTNAPTTNAGESTRSYVKSSTNTLQSINQPELASISPIGSHVHRVQTATDLMIRASSTAVPNNAVISPQIYSHLYTQSSSNITPNLTITPINTRPIIVPASSAQLETVVQENLQNQCRPRIGIINVPQIPNRSSCPTSSTNIQERIVATVPQVQPSISAIESVNTNTSSQIDVLQNEEPHGPVPSSSHCHPFVRRMPISGKMRMFFGNPNSMD